MNWRISKLDRYQLVSNSDAHSPSKLGREANLSVSYTHRCEAEYILVIHQGQNVFTVFFEDILLESGYRLPSECGSWVTGSR